MVWKLRSHLLGSVAKRYKNKRKKRQLQRLRAAKNKINTAVEKKDWGPLGQRDGTPTICLLPFHFLHIIGFLNETNKISFEEKASLFGKILIKEI